MENDSFIAYLLILIAAIGSFLWKKLSLAGAVSGFFVACSLYLGSGYSLLLLLGVFFIVGSLASRWKRKEKQVLTLEQENQGQRGVANVISNGGVAAILSLATLYFPGYKDLFILMAATAIASACSDTLASELGNIYGKRYVNILSFKKAERGQDGVVSLEGSFAAVLGSSLIALCFYFFNTSWENTFFVFIGGFLGCILDSILGATLQQWRILNNHTVNFFSTFFAALFILIIY